MQPTSRSAVSRWLARLGPMRIALVIMTVLDMALAPAPGTRAVYHGWPLVSTVLAPVFAPLMLMLLLLDALMARVFLSDAEGGDRARFRGIIALNLGLAAVLILYWIPYYSALRP